MSLKRILFVTHAFGNPYGASTSLRLLLENYRDVECDLVVPRSIRRRLDLAAAAAPFPSVRQVFDLSLPQDLSILGIANSPSDAAHQILHRSLWQWERGRFLDIVRRNSYDAIHLNSPILHGVICNGLPVVTHMRDIILNSDSPVVDKIAGGLGIIFIDSTTRKPFEHVLKKVRSIVLNNPIDMSDLATYKGALSHPGLSDATTVFGVIGRISEIKGVEFIIRAFRAGAGSDAVLLIVGDGPAGYVELCRAAAGDDRRIIFWGEETEIKKIYAVTDYVVRGDPQGCIGRTVYEGLYSGCRVIMPGLGESDFLFEAERYLDAVQLYRAGSLQSLIQAFMASTGKKVLERFARSNIADYVRAFDGFLDLCLATADLAD